MSSLFIRMHGKRFDLALAYAKGLGALRAGALQTTFRDETEEDLFGEQAVLMGGVCQLMQTGLKSSLRQVIRRRWHTSSASMR